MIKILVVPAVLLGSLLLIAICSLTAEFVQARWRGRGRVRILYRANDLKPYQVQQCGLLGWRNEGSPREREAWARHWAEHLIEREYNRRAKPPAPEVIAEYDPLKEDPKEGPK